MPQENTRLRWALWALLSVVLCVVCVYHEPFRDEVDIWLVSRDTSLQEFFEYFRNTPHPPLWYFLNVPFARAGFGIWVQPVLSVGATLATAWLLLFRSAFPLYVVAPLLFSAQVAYQLGVVSRGYSIELPLLFATAWRYPFRLHEPRRYFLLLAGMALAEIWLWPAVGILGLCFVVELWKAHAADKSRSWSRDLQGLFIASLAVVSLPIMLWPAPNANPAITTVTYSASAFWNQLQQAFMPLRSLGYLFGGGPFDNPIGGDREWLEQLLLVPGVAAFVLTVIKLRRQMIALSVLLTSLAWFYYIITFKYSGFFWHAIHLPFFILGALWLATDEQGQSAAALSGWSGRLLALILTLSFGYSAVMGLWMMKWDLQQPYSGGRDAGEYVAAQTKEAEIVVGVGCEQLEPPFGYLPKRRVWRAGIERYLTMMPYELFNLCQHTPYDVMVQRIEATFPERHGMWLVADRPIDLGRFRGLRLERFSPGLWENIWTYRFE